jgi:hypothetical protein
MKQVREFSRDTVGMLDETANTRRKTKPARVAGKKQGRRFAIRRRRGKRCR